MQRADVRMVQRGNRAHLVLEPIDGGCRGKFDRDITANSCIAGFIHFPHATAAKQRQDLVSAEASAGSEGQVFCRGRGIIPARLEVRRKYRRLFSSSPCPKKPGPKGPTNALIHAIVELESRNHTFGVDIDKNVVHRVLSKHYRHGPGGTGPSWLSFIGHTTDSLWSGDLFRCESIVLRSYRVLVVMDQFTRRLVGVGVHCGAVNGADLCRMFNAATHGRGVPRHLSTDHDPLFEAHRWTANELVLRDCACFLAHGVVAHVQHMPRQERPLDTERRVRLFKNGRNQALRIPRDLELPGHEAILRKDGHRLVVEPVARPSLLAVLATLKPLGEDFLRIKRLAAEPVDL
jgi:virulence-associated protein VagC